MQLVGACHHYIILITPGPDPARLSGSRSGSYNYEKESVSKRDQQNGIITFSSQKYFHPEGQVTESPRVLAQNLFNTYIKVKQDVGGRYQVYA